MRLTGADIVEGLEHATRWWLDALWTLVPGRVKRMISYWRRVLVIESHKGRLALYLQSQGRRQLVCDLSYDNADVETAGQALVTMLADHPIRVDHIILHLVFAPVLQRQVRLPWAARRSIRESVGYDLDRQTPFSPDQVYYGVKEYAADRRTGHIDVILEVVRRTDLDPVLAVLDAAGIVPDRVAKGPDHPDLLPANRSGFAGLFAPRVTAGLATLVILLTIAAAWLPLERVQDARDALSPRLQEARSNALAVDDLRRELEQLEARQTVLLKRRQSEPLVVELLLSLTSALPSSAFLIEMGYQSDEITMSGYAGSASDVLTAIENAPGLSGARFLSPVTQDQRVGRERFSISVQATRRPISASVVADVPGAVK